MPSDNIPSLTDLETDSESKKTSRPRRRFQFSLRTLLIFVSVVGVLCGYLGMFIQSVQKQRSAVRKIQQLGGTVHYDYQFNSVEGPPSPPGPVFLRRFFGDDLFTHVEFVSLYSETVSVKDNDLGTLRELPHLKHLELNGPGITDEGMKIVAEIPELITLSLSNTKITGDGLKLLERNKNLHQLYLRGVSVHDATIANIDKLPNLHSLILRQTSITDAGLAPLAGLSQLQAFNVSQNSAITGKGLEYVAKTAGIESLWFLSNSKNVVGLEQIKKLRKLKLLWIDSVSFSDDDLEIVGNLEQLEILNLSGTSVADRGLEKLKTLKNLKQLHIEGTKVTKDGLSQLKGLEKLRNVCVGPGIVKQDLSELRKELPECAFEMVSSAGLIEHLAPLENELSR